MKIARDKLKTLARATLLAASFCAAAPTSGEEKKAPAPPGKTGTKDDFFKMLDLKESDINNAKPPPSGAMAPPSSPAATAPATGTIPATPLPPEAPLPAADGAAAASPALIGTPSATTPASLTAPGTPVNVTPPAPDPELEKARTNRVQEANSLAGARMEMISPDGISLIDAVRMTLANNPQVKLGVEDAKLAESTLLSIQGAFDTSLSGKADYENKHQELTDKEKDKERQRYKAIRELYNTSETILARIKQVKSGKLDPTDFDYSGTALTESSNISNPDNKPEIESQLLAKQQLEQLVDIMRSSASSQQLKEIDALAVQAVASQEKLWQKIRRDALKTLREQPPWIVRRTEVQTYELSLFRKFRGGPSLELYGNYTGREDNFSKRANTPRENRSVVGLQLDLNLTKLGLGDLATAQERAAMQDFNARCELARDSAAQQVLSTVFAYWDLVAAQEKLQRLYLSELETLASTELAKQMIQNKVLPGVELFQVNARQIQAVASRFGAEIEVATAQQALALTMGFDPENIHEAPLASDPLPPLSDADTLSGLNANSLIRHTLMYHPGLVAFRYTGNAQMILEEQARRDLRPDVKTYVAGEFSGYSQNSGTDGTFGVWGSNHTGASFLAGLSFEWPFENREREGAYLAAQSDTYRNKLLENDARRQLATQVALNIKRIQIASEQGAKLSEATRLFGDALNAERQKIRGGTSTVVDVLFAEQNLTAALIQEIAARQIHARSLAEMRYTSFTLLPPFDYSALEQGISNLRITDDYFNEIPSPHLLSRYRGVSPSVAAATGSMEAFRAGRALEKPRPLLSRLFGKKDAEEDTSAPAAYRPYTATPAPVLQQQPVKTKTTSAPAAKSRKVSTVQRIDSGPPAKMFGGDNSVPSVLYISEPTKPPAPLFYKSEPAQPVPPTEKVSTGKTQESSPPKAKPRPLFNKLID